MMEDEYSRALACWSSVLSNVVADNAAMLDADHQLPQRSSARLLLTTIQIVGDPRYLMEYKRPGSDESGICWWNYRRCRVITTVPLKRMQSEPSSLSARAASGRREPVVQ